MIFGFIVEGFHDEQKIRSIYPTAEIVVTKGTRFRNRTRMDIDALLEKVDYAFLLTDPDPSGDKLAAMILNEYPLPRIHLDSKECTCYRNHKLKIGVEHADNLYLERTITPILAQYHHSHNKSV